MSERSSRSNNNNDRHHRPFDLITNPRSGLSSAPSSPCADINDISTSTAPVRTGACTSSAPSWRATETPDARQVRMNHTFLCLAAVLSVRVDHTPGRVSGRSHAALDIGEAPAEKQSISKTRTRTGIDIGIKQGSSGTSETPRGSLDLYLPTPTA